MSNAPRYIPRYTLDDYNGWEGDWELIDGVPISMSPSPFGHHERVISRLSLMMGKQIEQQRCPCSIYTNLDWIVDNFTVLRPDLMVVCGDQPDRHLEQPPELAVEVLSSSTRGGDLTAKRAICLENKVSHYIILDPDQRTTLHITPAGEFQYDEAGTIQLVLDDQCAIRIEPAALFDRHVP